MPPVDGEHARTDDQSSDERRVWEWQAQERTKDDDIRFLGHDPLLTGGRGKPSNGRRERSKGRFITLGERLSNGYTDDRKPQQGSGQRIID